LTNVAEHAHLAGGLERLLAETGRAPCLAHDWLVQPCDTPDHLLTDVLRRGADVRHLAACIN
jgi:hypothetical protein